MGIFSIFKSKKKKQNEKYNLGLHKSRQTLGSLKKVLESSNTITDDLYDEIEEILIGADIGVDTTLKFMEILKNQQILKNISNPLELQEIIVDEIFNLYLEGEIVKSDINYVKGNLNVYMFVGVNGTGKTTSIGKLAHKFKSDNNKVLLIAADTFRAGAIEQLEVWAKRANVSIFKKEPGTDPSSVIYDGLMMAKHESYDVVLIDTAGRLHNKVSLMNELSKMRRVIDKVTGKGPEETLLVIDATTGQNGIRQAEIFKEATDVTGVVLTKLDGTAKGGIVLAIKNLYQLPIKFVGLGEKITDLVLFDIEEYIYGLFSDFFGG
ncbi:MAG: signal recognition particle-docking protein FtsY [Acholeplasmataceae bacterium]|nr:signal recognition particle-docking protein FtsY [Acholeplasmataceae bacterium]